MKKIFKILNNPIVKRSALAAIGLTTISIVGANYVADGREQEIERELEAFTQQVPVQTEYNETAIALKTLSAKLGFNLYSWPEDANSEYAPQIENIEVEPSSKQAWEVISDPLEEYIRECCYLRLLNPGCGSRLLIRTKSRSTVSNSTKRNRRISAPLMSSRVNNSLPLGISPQTKLDCYLF